MNFSENKKFYYFEIYYLEKSAGTSYKYQSSFHEKFLLDYLSDEDLKTVTKNAFQELVSGLKNEDSDISFMLDPYMLPDLEVHLNY